MGEDVRVFTDLCRVAEHLRRRVGTCSRSIMPRRSSSIHAVWRPGMALRRSVLSRRLLEEMPFQRSILKPQKPLQHSHWWPACTTKAASCPSVHTRSKHHENLSKSNLRRCLSLANALGYFGGLSFSKRPNLSSRAMLIDREQFAVNIRAQLFHDHVKFVDDDCLTLNSHEDK